MLAEALLLARGGDCGGLGVVLADLVAAVVVLGGGEVGLAALSLAPRGLVVVGGGAEPQPQHAHCAGSAEAGAHQQAVHGQHVRRGKVCPAAEVQPDRSLYSKSQVF